MHNLWTMHTEEIFLQQVKKMVPTGYYEVNTRESTNPHKSGIQMDTMGCGLNL